MALILDRLNIMVVDDNPHMRVLVRDILHGFGVKNIAECTNGNEAIEQLRLWPADIVIVDWVMEVMDGLELTRLIRTAPDSPNVFVPIIMLTGHTELHRIIEARDAGVTEFLAKPVNANGIYSRIRAVVEQPRPFVRIGEYLGPCRRRRLEDFAGTGRREADGSSPEEVSEVSETMEEGLSDAAAAVDGLNQ